MITWDMVKFVVGADGQPMAVQVDIEVWQQIIAALEDAEDVALAREALVELEAAGGNPEKVGWLRLEDVQKAWEADDTP
jgi:predicted nuclease of predicted toxin-antitoxin system